MESKALRTVGSLRSLFWAGAGTGAGAGGGGEGSATGVITFLSFNMLRILC